ncbi:hypothetical protein SLE2022_387320 [Rubroshorea leprosula]
METVLYLCHGIPPTMPLPPATANKLCFNSRRSSSLSLSSGRKKTLRGRVIECSGGRKLKRGASFQSTAIKLGALKSLLDVMNCLDLHRSDTHNTQGLTQQKAVEILKEEYQNCEKETLCDPFVYAEILICLGRFEEALELDCLKESHPSDSGSNFTRL